MYVLGVDLGTTFTAAATWRDGHAEVASLGSRAAVIPSVVLLREDETVLTGEAANRRGLTEPQRVAREFKRRFGDTTPVLLGGVPYSVEALMAKLLRSVVEDVAAREGGWPERVCVSHPANWGPYKRELLDQMVRLTGVGVPVTFAAEPAAAAVFYARQQRVEPGAVVAVYDLGGGTFDATVLRKGASGFGILGDPEGIERLGGIDFDAAVFHHVGQALGGKLAELDEEDSSAVAAVARLREECVAAKEALSSDTDTSISVLLPNVSTEVRLTRAELEAMVRPTLLSTVEALRRALDKAGVAAEDLHSVLLVGGSSRMPLVTQLVGAELGRPVAVDAHPKHAVALGAAWLASDQPPDAPVQGAPVDAMQRAAPEEEPTSGTGSGAAAGTGPPSAGDQAAVPAREQPPPAPPAPPTPPDGGRRRRALPVALAGLVAILLLTGGGIWWGINQGGDDGGDDQDTDSGAVVAGTTEPEVPPDEECSDAVMANERWVCLTGAAFQGDELVIDYEAEWAGSVPDISTGFHLHIWGSDGNRPPDSIMGTHAGDRSGDWVIKDGRPAVLSAAEVAEVIGDREKVCARIADADHALVPDNDGEFVTGNCVPIER
ncbi:Hsp70 family protein [Haloechinothrix sp. YIM 98757]|uniref:Hsp70 family protein n=1 Tax=Haloechinothrix aidingensis TaxID=2752311 RepID=A0A838A5J4_9PSEU|nr:Hsp70 family protein [Haloechinothrix aidingensis]MBA0125020.1 Hsp70 family protein [Haloechinothrix aidingensis]